MISPKKQWVLSPRGWSQGGHWGWGETKLSVSHGLLPTFLQKSFFFYLTKLSSIILSHVYQRKILQVTCNKLRRCHNLVRETAGRIFAANAHLGAHILRCYLALCVCSQVKNFSREKVIRWRKRNKQAQRRKAGPVPGYFSRISVLARWKTCVNAIFSPWNPDPLSLTPRGPVLPLFCGFMKRTNFLGWRELFTNRCLWALNLAFDFGRNTSTLSESIRDVDLRDFPGMWPKHSRNKD